MTSNEINKEGGPVTEVAPGVYTYTVSENGNAVTIWDSSGHRVVVRPRLDPVVDHIRHDR